MRLRNYQEAAITAIRNAYLAGYKCPLLVLPTGGGKTVCFSFIARSAAAKGKRVLVLAHRTELISQAGKKLSEMGVRAGLISPKFTPRYDLPVQVASVQTLVNRFDKVAAPDLIIVDEGHHAPAGTWGTILAEYPKALVLGVTATPVRSDNKGLRGVYDILIQPEVEAEIVSAKWLMEQGFLSQATVFSPDSGIDFKGLRKGKSGDFTAGSASKAVDKPTITGNAVSLYRKHANYMPALAFCASVAHATTVAEEFRAAGYRVGLLAGKITDGERKDMIDGLAYGKYHVLCACDMVSEGTDIPVCSVAILMRPTASLGLHLQQVGRVLRPVYAEGYALGTDEERLEAIRVGPKPRAIIIDMAGNVGRWEGDLFVENHGFPETEWEWSLDEDKPAKKRETDEEAQVKTSICEACYAFYKPAPRCPMCGHSKPVKARKILITEGELREAKAQEKAQEQARVEASKDENKRIKSEAFRCTSYGQMVDLGNVYGKPSSWAFKMWNTVSAWRQKKGLPVS